MLNVIELFSGIGSQAKALSRIEIEFRILATCDWDINAIIAYDIIHNGVPNIEEFENLSNDELNERLCKYTLSANGKVAMTEKGKKNLPRNSKMYLLAAIERSNNLIDITSVKYNDLPNQFNVLTYSFPCQDLSNAGFWQGNQGGIDRDANNRSCLLWQVERILYERYNEQDRNPVEMPRFLLMENVIAIKSSRNNANFEEWKRILNDMNYVNKVMDLNALDFGVPQNRRRTFMISVYCGENDNVRNYVENIFEQFDENNFHRRYNINQFTMRDVIKDDYDNQHYLHEALYSNPKATDSRLRIGLKTEMISQDTVYVPTITTKQDRYPNSGLINFNKGGEGRTNFRYLTPRESFILMGFTENDFNALIDNDFETRRNNTFFTRDKLNRMAGNSICVNVLEAIFTLINEINNEIDEILL